VSDIDYFALGSDPSFSSIEWDNSNGFGPPGDMQMTFTQIGVATNTTVTGLCINKNHTLTFAISYPDAPAYSIYPWVRLTLIGSDGVPVPKTPQRFPAITSNRYVQYSYTFIPLDRNAHITLGVNLTSPMLATNGVTVYLDKVKLNLGP
jgi:hypothetical protein